jgi:hypothetical protein
MLVRLAHLFESHGFRRSFASHLSKILAESFDYVKVVQLPGLADAWRETRRAKLKTLSGGRSGKRAKNLMAIEMIDNGDVSSTRIAHWCTGCCHNSMDALKKLVKQYVKHFSTGFSVPLLYRWKHAEEAQDYIRDDSLVIIET